MKLKQLLEHNDYLYGLSEDGRVYWYVREMHGWKEIADKVLTDGEIEEWLKTRPSINKYRPIA